VRIRQLGAEFLRASATDLLRTIHRVGNGDQHIPVLLDEVVSFAAAKSGSRIIDCTFGRGGHASALVASAGQVVEYIAIDRDESAADRFAEWAADQPAGVRATFFRGDFVSVLRKLVAERPSSADVILLDLGVSSPQLDDADRGFSYMNDAPLDMRMDQTSGRTAAVLLEQASEDELVGILRDLGEEKFARRIAKAVASRNAEGHPVQTTLQLVELVEAAVPRAGRRPGHVAKRVFQALRLAVNEELEQASVGLDLSLRLLAENGRLLVISFHSLEDRIVKRRMRSWESPCICPPDLPICACGLQPLVHLVTGKAVRPGANELAVNPRAGSALLRVCQRSSASIPDSVAA
jgi:16S rRNA (cytosine1402-N4)-methyltransferase